MELYTPASSLPKDFDHESIDVDRNVPPPTSERPTESRHSHSNSDSGSGSELVGDPECGGRRVPILEISSCRGWIERQSQGLMSYFRHR